MARVAVVVSTYNRAGYLRELVKCLEAQTFRDFEAVIVDNASTDDTPTTGLATLRLDANRGPGGGRNAGVAVTDAEIIVFTDDDCLPTPTWLEHLVPVFDDPDVVVVQGRVDPDPATRNQMGPFDHTISVHGPSPFFETANVAYRRTAFDAVGGFHERTGRAFGEDALLGAAVLARGGRRAYVDVAVVYHRCVSRTFEQHLADERQLRLFAGLPGLKSGFLNRTTALFDLGVVGVIGALALRRAWPLVLALPWLNRRLRATRGYTGNDVSRIPRILAKYAVSDAVAFASLAEGAIKHRRFLL
ncbi:MAG TPA: glycosyltransferase family A protein [Acidimicrobiales bacterium]|nr:glycosyltransferase family A protein [Acidimicrobiales bacterium]